MSSVFGRILLVTGSAELLSDRAVKRAKASIVAEADDIEIAETMGTAVGPGELAAMTSPSLFCPQAGVIITDLQDLGDAGQSELLAYAQDPSSDVAVILVHAGGNKGKGLLDKLRKLPAVSEVKVVAPKWESEYATWVRNEVRELGAAMTEEAALFLVRAVGQDLRALAGGADQLVATIDRGSPVSIEIVRQYFGGRAEVKGFDIADAAIEGHIPSALEQLRWAELNNVAAVLITSAFASGLRNLARLWAAPKGLKDFDLASMIGAPPFRIKALRRQLSGWDEAGLAHALEAVAIADLGVKGGAADPSYALERMVLDVARSRR
ncbi:DNA polymerase III subunit delta [soil metagenome]